MRDTKKELIALFDEKNVVQKDLAAFLGVHEVTVSRWVSEKGVRIPGADVLLKVCDYCGVPANRLVDVPGRSDNQKVNDDSDFVTLPLLSPVASAGPGETTEEEQVLNVMKFQTSWLRERVGVSHRRLKIIQADGGSMKPTIEPGDNLIVDVGNNAFVADGVYVLRVGDLLMVKRLTMGLSGEIEVTSDNKNHPAFRVDPKKNPHELVISGRVLARLAVDIERL